MSDILASIFFFLFYVAFFAVSLFIIARAGVKDIGRAFRRMREKKLSFREVFFRVRPYNLWPENEVSIKESVKRGMVFSAFIFSLTGILGTTMRWTGLSKLDFMNIFYLSLMTVLLTLPIATLIHYLQQRIVKKFGKPAT